VSDTHDAIGEAELLGPNPAVEQHPRTTWSYVFRGALLLATAISLYLLAPALLSVFSSWPELRHLQPAWLAGALLFEAFSFVSMWELWRIALRTPSWFAVGTAQLAGNSMGSLIPGGSATASAFSYRMLVRAGIDSGSVASGMTASFFATTSAVFALPILVVPALIGGLAAPHGLIQTAWIGAIAFVVIALAGSAALAWDRPLLLVGRAVRSLLSHTPKRDSVGDLPERLIAQRNAVRSAFGARWYLGLAAAVGKWGFDYLALVCCLAAVGSRPNSSLVLLAYTGASLLKLIPLTPGGLGFVEAGLTGLLALAGVGAQDAVVATLAYRLVGFWLPLPIGGVAYLLFRRRYGADGVTATSTASPP
jgi:uncharacterized protein (TIRG00374 family)